MKRLAILAAFGLVLTTPCHGEGWSEFRGPTGQGHVLDGPIPTTWSKDKNVVWKREIAGSGWSSPVVAGGACISPRPFPMAMRKTSCCA